LILLHPKEFAVLLEAKQPIAGVTPSSVAEADIMTVWPSICAYPSGRFLGTLYGIKFPNINRIFRLGNVIALASHPHALFLYFYKLLPYVGMRYTLTNRRVIVQRGSEGIDERWVNLDNFNAIKVDVRPGQEWFKAGDLIFLNGQREVFRLEGVSRPDAFRAACMKAHMANVGVKLAMGGRAN
jgi:hypothetical protein